jgi:hypothetical protein
MRNPKSEIKNLPMGMAEFLRNPIAENFESVSSRPTERTSQAAGALPVGVDGVAVPEKVRIA